MLKPEVHTKLIIPEQDPPDHNVIKSEMMEMLEKHLGEIISKDLERSLNLQMFNLLQGYCYCGWIPSDLREDIAKVAIHLYEDSGRAELYTPPRLTMWLDSGKSELKPINWITELMSMEE